MPWPEDAPFYNFNEFSILLNAKSQYGVYAIFHGTSEPLLIGAGDTMNDLLRLAEDGDRQSWRAEPVLFSYILAPMEEATALKRQLTAELLPGIAKDKDKATGT